MSKAEETKKRTGNANTGRTGAATEGRTTGKTVRRADGNAGKTVRRADGTVGKAGGSAAKQTGKNGKKRKKKRQILNSWTVVLQQTESLKYFRMDMVSFVLTIIFREMEMSMLLLHRFADSGLKQAIS